MSILTNDDGSLKLPILISALFISLLLVGVIAVSAYGTQYTYLNVDGKTIAVANPHRTVVDVASRVQTIEVPGQAVITEKIVEVPVQDCKSDYVPISMCPTCHAWVEKS